MRGVRLDSGDLIALSQATRKILDDAGLSFTRIYASGGLDEHQIEQLVRVGAPIDVFGVGTDMGVSHDAPSLDMAYKLVEYDGRPRLKLSTDKISLVGKKQIFRTQDTSGTYERDLIGLREESVDAVAHEAGVATDRIAPLLRPVMTQGRVLQPLPTLLDSRARFLTDFTHLPPAIRTLRPEVPYSVNLTGTLSQMQQETVAQVQQKRYENR